MKQFARVSVLAAVLTLMFSPFASAGVRENIENRKAKRAEKRADRGGNVTTPRAVLIPRMTAQPGAVGCPGGVCKIK